MFASFSRHLGWILIGFLICVIGYNALTFERSFPVHIEMMIKPPRTFSIDILPSDTVRDVKTKIQNKEGIPPVEQRLFRQDHPLCNDQVIDRLGIVAEERLKLDVLLKIRIAYENGTWILDDGPTSFPGRVFASDFETEEIRNRVLDLGVPNYQALD